MCGVPGLSVVVLSFREGPRLHEAVASLLRQSVVPEVVVTHSGSEAPDLGDDRVVVTASPQRRLPGAARNAGVAASTGDDVAFLAGDRASAAPCWVEERLRLHRAGAAAVASSLVPTSRDPSAIASHLLQHSTRMPHLRDPRPDLLFGVSYSRAILDRFGPFPRTSRERRTLR